MKRKIINTVHQEPVKKEECRHYWVIESPSGLVSKGICKFCGAERDFFNSFPYLEAGKKLDQRLQSKPRAVAL